MSALGFGGGYIVDMIDHPQDSKQDTVIAFSESRSPLKMSR
jgi:hypothetical protein